MSSLVHASTSLLRTRAQFVRFVDHVQAICKSRVLFYTLSHDVPDLEQSVKQLTSCARESIGCLSGPLPLKRESSFFSCSVAVFEEDGCRPFSSLKTGEGPVQVGRWHAYRKKNDEDVIFDGLGGQRLDADVNWEELWNSKSSSRFLPQELQDTTNTQSFLYFSDSSSWNLASALHEHLPQSQQLGIVASSTPFVTGQPFTLVRNGKAQSTGAVGLALQSPPLDKVLRFDGLVQITPPLPVRKAEGNLIHELGDSLPARILLKAIQDHELPDAQAKDLDYYIGIRDATEGEKTHVTKLFPKVLRIVAGSPSQGSIAVEEVAAPPVGSLVEFYYRPKSSSAHLPLALLPQTCNATASDMLIGALVDNLDSNHLESSSLLSLSEPEDREKSATETYGSSFLVSTEHGFVLSAGPRGKALTPWKCTVPGTFGGLRFPLL
ncbi:hypothetical protein DFH11DRAFT_1543945 [Phellopilus nigrolimitatus]|nr:hypothetical protein DFH11DRAFT_1543945 [Phellopilus nigrolimitatus]